MYEGDVRVFLHVSPPCNTCGFKMKFPSQCDIFNWPVPFSSALLSVLLLLAVDSTKTVAATRNQQCGNPLQQTLRLSKLLQKESVDLIKTYVSTDINLQCFVLVLRPHLLLLLVHFQMSLIGCVASLISVFAESLSRRHVGALLQGVRKQHPGPQHLWLGGLGEDSEHLHTTPSLPPTSQMGGQAAEGLTAAWQPTVDTACHSTSRQQEPGCSNNQLLSEPLPQPACDRAGMGADITTSISEHLPAEGLWVWGPEDVQGVSVKRFQRTTDSKKQRVQTEDAAKHIPLLRMLQGWPWTVHSQRHLLPSCC